MIGTLDKRWVFRQKPAETKTNGEIRDEVLVWKTQNGQTDAFGLIYEEYVDRIYRYVFLRTGQAEQAEDLTHDVFCQAFRGVGSYKQTGKPFLSWLLRIAHNLVIDYYRKAGKHRMIRLNDEIPVSWQDPVTAAEKSLAMMEIAKAMLLLPAAQKEVISLRFVVGLSTAETAAVMGRSEGAVKTLQHEAVVKLRKMVKGNMPDTSK
jgi:RNA polymerase sigma-70 factor, ECF subfamily